MSENKNFYIMDINIQGKEEKKSHIIPSKGYYVNMYWDSDEEDLTIAGPFPEEHKDLVIEFLNILQNMIKLYPNGKGGWDDYYDVAGYSKYFEGGLNISKISKKFSDEELVLQEIRNFVGAEIPYEDDGTVCAELLSVDVFYHDGISSDNYTVEIMTDTGESLFLIH